MTPTSRRSVITRLLSIPILGSLVGLNKVEAVGAAALPSTAPADHRALGLRTLRFLNTLEHWYRSDEGHFGTLSQLAGSSAKSRLAADAPSLKYFKLSDDVIRAMRLVDGSEIVPGWKIALVLRNGTTGYWISLEDMIGSNGLFTTDDRGVINTPGNAGYQLPAGVEPSRFAKAGAMLRTVAFFQEEGGDCCSDHMCCCACTCSQTFTNGAKNCGCVACTWCPACT